MTAAAFAGWTTACVNLLPNFAFANTNALQIANFSIAGAQGLAFILVDIPKSKNLI